MWILINQTPVNGVQRAPTSKSYTIRALMCAARAEGESELVYPLSSDDTGAALRVLKMTGIKFREKNSSWFISGGKFKTPSADLFCGDSAATLRFMCALGALIPGQSRLTAGNSLSRRPVKILVDALRMWGVDISCKGETAPVDIRGGFIRGGETEIRGDISSQFVSALLLVLSQADTEAGIRLTSPLESRAYVQMTLECLRQFGIEIEHSVDLMEFRARPQKYRACRYVVEGDWSSASYLLSLGAVTGEMKVANLNPESLQGDKVLLEFLKMMGASVEVGADYILVKRNNLKAIEADLNECIDLLPTMGVLAGLADGVSVFTGIQRARIKESNRVATVREGLERTGIEVREEEDKLIITGGMTRPAVIDAHNDHRIAMAFSLIGVARGGITIDGAECISKTYPDYWDVLRNLGVKIDEQ